MMTSRPTLAWALTSLALALVLSGCGVSNSWRTDLRHSRGDVIGQLTAIASLLERKADFRVVGANGGFLSAGSAPTSSWEYAAGASTQESKEPLFSRMKRAAQALQSEGWKVQSSGRSPRPYVRLAKDGVTVGLDKPALRGSTAMHFGITGPEIRTPDSADVLPQRENLNLH